LLHLPAVIRHQQWWKTCCRFPLQSCCRCLSTVIHSPSLGACLACAWLCSACSPNCRPQDPHFVLARLSAERRGERGPVPGCLCPACFAACLSPLTPASLLACLLTLSHTWRPSPPPVNPCLPRPWPKQIFRSRIGSLRKALKSRAEFFFVDAPYPAEPADDQAVAESGGAAGQQGRSWW